MIEYIKGNIESLNAAAVVIENNGMAFRLNISLLTYEALTSQGTAKLFVHEIVREDGWTLYGFGTERERELFRALIGVSGVGAATAIIILSALPGDELAYAVTSGDVKKLKAIKGIGTKTAERIIVDLRDKLVPTGEEATAAPQLKTSNPAFNEALVALTMLGFDRKASEKALNQLFEKTPGLSVESAIKQALTLVR